MTETKKRFLIWGAKGHAKVLNEIIRLNNGEIIALVDQNADLDSPIKNLRVLNGYDGYIEWLNEMKIKNRKAYFILNLG